MLRNSSVSSSEVKNTLELVFKLVLDIAIRENRNKRIQIERKKNAVRR